MMNVSPPPFLEASNVSKRFPGVLALDGVSIYLREGETLAIVGENGAGKSTLMKVLAGIYQPDGGAIRLNDRYVRFGHVTDAMRAGITLIHQELNLAENLSVAANIFLGRERLRVGFFLNRGAMRRQAAALLERVGLPARLANVAVEHLAPGQKQLVEVARALGMDTRVIIMDEPTSSLTQGETDRLYSVIRDLQAAGVGIIYISHRLAEVNRVADRVVVLRDGKNAGELYRGQLGHDEMIRHMVGRDLKNLYPGEHRGRQPEGVALEVRNLRYRGGPATPVSFTINPGEVVGMAGLVGAGRTELAEAVFGIRAIEAGDVLLGGKPLRVRGPGEAIAAGVLLVPEDRRLHGLVLEEGVDFNLSLPNLDQLANGLGLVAPWRERKLAAELVERLRIKTPRLGQPAGLLSGGNQQKVVFGKWLARKPRVLILDEPTRGVDVGARSEIYGIIDQLAAQGVAVWLISSDLEEILGMSDRVLVLHEGTLAGELPRAELSEEAVMRLATGANKHEPVTALAAEAGSAVVNG